MRARLRVLHEVARHARHLKSCDIGIRDKVCVCVFVYSVWESCMKMPVMHATSRHGIRDKVCVGKGERGGDTYTHTLAVRILCVKL